MQEGYGQFAEGEEDIQDFAKNGPSTLEVTGAEGRDGTGKGMAETMGNLEAGVPCGETHHQGKKAGPVLLVSRLGWAGGQL